MKQKTVFIVYSDSSKYSLSKKHILELAKHSGFFDNCIGYTKKDLEPNFIKTYKNILNQKRGGGYYLWKPKIIQQTLERISFGDILVYTDAGSSFNFYGKKRFFEYIEMLNSSEFGNLRFENKQDNLEKYWTSKEIFDEFKISPESKDGNSVQLMGGHLIFKKNDHTLNFLNRFFKIINSDEKLITDFYKDNQIPNFKENRHDQSIMSLLTKVDGGIILKNETYFKPGSEIQKNFPFLSVRNYGHGIKDRIKYNFLRKNEEPVYF